MVDLLYISYQTQVYLGDNFSSDRTVGSDRCNLIFFYLALLFARPEIVRLHESIID